MDYSPPAPLSMGFSRQEYWSGLPFSPSGDLPNPEIERASLSRLHWQAGSLPLASPGKPCQRIRVLLLLRGHPLGFLTSKTGVLEGLSSVQSLSCVRLLATPWTAARQTSLSITNCQSLPKPMSMESVMPFNHLILCHPLLLLPSIFPSIRVFSNESALRIR